MLRSKTGTIDVGKKSARFNWDWAGHVVVWMMTAGGKFWKGAESWRRRQGLPRKRWRYDLHAHHDGWFLAAQKKFLEIYGGGFPSAVGHYRIFKKNSYVYYIMYLFYCALLKITCKLKITFLATHCSYHSREWF